MHYLVGGKQGTDGDRDVVKNRENDLLFDIIPETDAIFHVDARQNKPLQCLLSLKQDDEGFRRYRSSRIDRCSYA